MTSKVKEHNEFHHLFRIRDNSILRGFYCIPFTECMLSGNILLDYTNLFSPNDYKEKVNTTHKYFKDKFDNP